MLVIKTLFLFGPLFFGLAFLAPLTAQLIEYFRWDVPFGLSRLEFGVILGGLLGLIATIRGRWV